MLSDIKINSAQRITEIREHLDFLTPLIPSAPIATPRYLNTSKGLIYVQLYGVIEYTMNSLIARAIHTINIEGKKLQELKQKIWGMALNAEFDSLNNANRKKWNKRNEIFQRIIDNLHIPIATNIMPTNGGNFSVPQLESIWSTFHISDPIFNDITFRGRLQEIVTNRINIAHGNNSASEVGAGVTNSDLYNRISDVSKYCSYVIDVFENYLAHKVYEA